jgi:hypothetical protein
MVVLLFLELSPLVVVLLLHLHTLAVHLEMVAVFLLLLPETQALLYFLMLGMEEADAGVLVKIISLLLEQLHLMVALAVKALEATFKASHKHLAVAARDSHLMQELASQLMVEALLDLLDALILEVVEVLELPEVPAS